MTEFKYCVYCGENGPVACFDNEAEAMKYAREDTGMYTSVIVEKNEIDETGETVNSEVLWSASNAELPEDAASDNPFNTEFPKSDIEDIGISDDEYYDEIAKQYEDEKYADTTPADWDDPNRFTEAVNMMEENESEVECKCCFDLFPKENCIKTEKGYICKKCNDELHSHQGTNLDLIDKDPFDLDYDDPRLPEEDEEPEIKEKPVDANEVRKFESGIEEKLEEHINDRPADIESDQVLQGTDNAIVDCEVAKVIAHSEDEKPLDCKMEKPVLDEPLAGEKADVKLNEDLKVIIDFSEYKPWSGAVETYELIKDADKLDELEAYLEECYPDGVTETQINDILWFDSEQVLQYLGLGDTEKEYFDENLNEVASENPFDSEAKVGDKIRIIHLEGEDNSYDSAEGTVEYIDGIGQLHGTWGGLAVIPGVDEFEIITEGLKEATKVIWGIESYDHNGDAEYEEFDTKSEALKAYEETVDWLKNDPTSGFISVALYKQVGGEDEPVDYIKHFSLEESLKEAKAKPEGDRVQSYNNGLKLAKVYNKPVIYGYTNSSYGNKYFALDDPIICDNVSDETKKFRQQYKSCNVVYVAYPSGTLIERLLEDAPEGTTEVDYVEYKHSYCHALEPKLADLKKINDIEELKKAILDIINNDPQVNWTKKEKKFAAIVRHKKWKSVEDLKTYLDNSFARAKEIKVLVDQEGELVKKLAEEIEFDENGDEVFTPEEQEEFDCDEWGYSNSGYDQYHHCGWCEEIYPESDMRHEVDFGWICDRCEDELKSHGGPLTFIED